MTAIAEGEAYINAAFSEDIDPDGDYSADCIVHVESTEPTIGLRTDFLPLETGSTGTIDYYVYPADAEITWHSSDTTVATVANGVVTPVGPGVARIDASITVGGTECLSNDCFVVVQTAGEPGIYVVPDSFLNSSIDDWYGIKAATFPANAEVTWTTSDDTVAIYDESEGSPLIKCLGVGTATITATITVDGTDYSDTCTVTVIED